MLTTASHRPRGRPRVGDGFPHGADGDLLRLAGRLARVAAAGRLRDRKDGPVRVSGVARHDAPCAPAFRRRRGFQVGRPRGDWRAVVRLQARRAKLRLRQLCRPRSRWFRRNAGTLAVGVGFGLLVLAAMFGLYQLVWKPNPAFAGASQAIREKIVGLGIGRLWMYAAVGVFYALCHSALEEYYWRWFVFGQLRSRLRLVSAVAISSLAFMAHHVILLATYFGWSSPWTYAFSLSVAAGGAVWAWLYERSGSLIGPWLSHLVVDAAIFLVGYDWPETCWCARARRATVSHGFSAPRARACSGSLRSRIRRLGGWLAVSQYRPSCLTVSVNLSKSTGLTT